MTTNQPPSPTKKAQRITAIDTLRGFALLGILVMNIMSFSMPDAAYSNPNVYGGNDLLNHLVYCFVHIFADQKFMAIFSMLFGASVMLLLSKLKEQGKSGAKIHYVRNVWLLVFGLLHAVFLWDGDILAVYALCSFILFFFRNIKPRVQFILGVITFLLPSLVSIAISTQLPNLDTQNQQVLVDNFSPSEQEIAKDIAIYQGPYFWQLDFSEDETTVVSTAQNLVDIAFVTEAFLRAFGMMLIGMAFYTLDILTAKRSASFYKRMMQVGFVIGFPVVLFGLYQYISHDWEASYSLFLGRIPNHIATIFIASCYTALIMFWSKFDLWQRAQDALAAVGRMALSNYIGQSVLATFIFYGFGLGLYGQLNRVAQLGVVLLIWFIQIVVSQWWLKRFRYGPLEWFWRSLIYFRLEPLMP